MTLDRAQAGDADAFRDLTEPYRRELQLHCYRILGSLTDAEDMLQETLIAAWRGLDKFEGRSSLRTWLYRIATNRCLNALRDAGRRIPVEPVPPFQPPEPTRRGEVTWLQPYPDTLLEHLPAAAPGPEARYEAREAVELAFIVALQQMPPRQAAILILRDVLGFPGADVACMLDTTEIAVKGALQRARAALTARHADGRQPAPAAGSSGERELTRRFAEAFVAADIDGVVALLVDDAWLSMPPAPHEYHGISAITEFFRTSMMFSATRRLSLKPTRANTQAAFSAYLTEPDGTTRPAGLIVLTLTGNRIEAITRFHTNALLTRFELTDRPQ